VGVYSGPEITESGLVLNYDFGNLQKSFGTTNLIPNAGVVIYNNVPSDVTASLVQTSDTYRGSPVWQLTLTPTTVSGVSYLTAANNPGIGVVTGGGGGTGGVYTGHSIFFKSTVPLHGPAPIYTHYSNIPGYQTYTTYDDMGDGWYRAHVVWYDSVTRSDGKYWAINPASATLNVPIVIYWAAPFKESQNYTNFVSAYTLNTRGSGSGIVNLVNSGSTGGRLINGPTYSNINKGSLVFDGTDDRIIIPTISLGNGNLPWTCTAWVKTTTTVNSLGTGSVLSNSSSGPVYSVMGVNGGKIVYWTYQNAAWSQKLGVGKTVNDNVWHFLSWVNYNNNTMDMYVDGILDSNVTNSTSGNNNPIDIIGGSWNSSFLGTISNVSIYNKALTSAEIQQNFNALRGRFGL
jgi:hypothetical protein